MSVNENLSHMQMGAKVVKMNEYLNLKQFKKIFCCYQHRE